MVGNHRQPLFRAIQFDMEVGTGEFLLVTGAKGKRPILNSKLLSTDEHSWEMWPFLTPWRLFPSDASAFSEARLW
jgi:hypothetical protein